MPPLPLPTFALTPSEQRAHERALNHTMTACADALLGLQRPGAANPADDDRTRTLRRRLDRARVLAADAPAHHAAHWAGRHRDAEAACRPFEKLRRDTAGRPRAAWRHGFCEDRRYDYPEKDGDDGGGEVEEDRLRRECCDVWAALQERREAKLDPRLVKDFGSLRRVQVVKGRHKVRSARGKLCESAGLDENPRGSGRGRPATATMASEVPSRQGEAVRTLHRARKGAFPIPPIEGYSHATERNRSRNA